MRIANSTSQFKILLSQTDKELLCANGEMALWMKVNTKGVMDFIRLSPRQMHGHERVSVIVSGPSGGANEPWMLLVTKNGKKWKHLGTLPLFSPETALMNPHEHSEGQYWDVMRPPMERAPNAGRKPQTRKPKMIDITPHRAPEAVSTALAIPELPKVEKSPPKAELTEAALINSLRGAINTINQAKEHYGEAMLVSVNDKGKLKLLLELGDD